jgi:hypothetical protein
MATTAGTREPALSNKVFGSEFRYPCICIKKILALEIKEPKFVTQICWYDDDLRERTHRSKTTPR